MREATTVTRQPQLFGTADNGVAQRIKRSQSQRSGPRPPWRPAGNVPPAEARGTATPFATMRADSVVASARGGTKRYRSVEDKHHGNKTQTRTNVQQPHSPSGTTARNAFRQCCAPVRENPNMPNTTFGARHLKPTAPSKGHATHG